MSANAEKKARALSTQATGILIQILQELVRAGRYLHPTTVTEAAEAMAEPAQEMKKTLNRLVMTDWPAGWEFVGDRLLEACARTETLVSDFRGAARAPEQTLQQKQALRGLPLIEEMLYPLCNNFPDVSAWFSEPGTVIPRLEPTNIVKATPRLLPPNTGIQHFGSHRSERGGVSFYAPEYYQDNRDWPLMIVLHGASGHGRNYIWSWLQSARSRGVLLLAPTSSGLTWPIVGENIDGDIISKAIHQVREKYRVDSKRILLAGLSDGATYSWLLGLAAGSACTHLASLSGTLHPLALHNDYAPRIKGKPVYWLQGALDTVFSLTDARSFRDILIEQGAELTYREVPDLAHTQARDENKALMSWLGCPQYL